jgi:hypothetical protein
MIKKFLYTILFSSSLFAQTKPTTPLAPSGVWADSLVRAYLFTRADSIASDSTKDWSVHNVWGITTVGVLGSWSKDSEGNFLHSGGINTSILCGSSSHTDQLTVVLRMKTDCSGSCGDPVNEQNQTDTPPNSYRYKSLSSPDRRYDFCVTTSSEVCAVGDTVASNEHLTFIGTYDGATIKAYSNGNLKNTASQTGNIDYATHIINIASSNNGAGGFTDWIGDVYMVLIYNRVLNEAEREAIWCDPYIAFKSSSDPCALSSGGIRRRFIVQ